jgi:putative acetyltransferase
MASNPREHRFTAVNSGKFMERFGPLGRTAAYSQKKLCLAATDLECLVEVLYRLSNRPDCYYVKYSTAARDGMYLGRCFLQTEQAVGRLCEALKTHPKLLVCLQDDAFFNGFREWPLPGQCHVWIERPEDASAVEAIHIAAFGRPDEARMVTAVRDAGGAAVALVAGVDGCPVGHVLFSPVTIDGRSEPSGLGLAPVAVLPAEQRSGIGSRLIETGLEHARMFGYRYVVVLGHPTYYPRFGFTRASSFGLRCEYPVPDELFMALELQAGCLEGKSGLVRYLPAFA